MTDDNVISINRPMPAKPAVEPAPEMRPGVCMAFAPMAAVMAANTIFLRALMSHMNPRAW